jgi:hypothetical protein
MKKTLLIVVIGMLLVSSLKAQEIRSWQKYVAPDRSWSFHYPNNFLIKPNGPVVEMTSGDEQILFIAIPSDAAKSARQVANDVLQLFKKDMPDLTASDWKTGHGNENQMVYFKSAYTQGGKKYACDGLVIKQTGQNQAIWVSYTAPTQGYSQPRAAVILRGVLTSFDTGADSQPPPDAASITTQANPEKASPQRQAKMRQNGEAFVFMLEFILRAPFTAEQEKAIFDELISGWRQQTDAELAKFDEYPKYANLILHGNKELVENLRSQLEKPLGGWLAEYPDDPGVKAIQSAISARGRIIVDAPQPLTAMSAQSIAEMLAYSHLLAARPAAMPGDVSPQTVAERKQNIITYWKSLSPESRKAALESQASWLITRAVLRFGSAEEIGKARANMANISAQSSASASAGSSKGTSSKKDDEVTKAINNMINSNTLMMANHATFVSYTNMMSAFGGTPSYKTW